MVCVVVSCIQESCRNALANMNMTEATFFAPPPVEEAGEHFENGGVVGGKMQSKSSNVGGARDYCFVGEDTRKC